MVTRVIKRDGSSEPFMPEKMHHWAYWADSKLNADWDNILEGATSGMQEEVSTTELQDSLIDYCVSMRDPVHVKMGTRLLLGSIYKEAYGGIAAPELKAFYKKMIEDGYWRDSGYSDDDLDILNSAIDHKKDFGYAYPTLKQFKDKYAVSAYGRCMESPQIAIMAIAMSNVSHEENKVVKAINLYKTLSNLLINLPTPSLNGERTNMAASPSCCVISGGDDAKSMHVVDVVAYEMTCNRSGIGAEKERRSPGDPVKGGTIKHQGAFHYIDHLRTAVKANKQMSRGGSATFKISCIDPEIMSLVRLKSQRTAKNFQIVQLDYSLAMNKVFLKAVADNDDWMLVSVYYAPRLYDLFHSGEPKAFKEEYDRVMADQNIKKKIVKARDLLLAHITEWFETGMNYSFFVDNVNQHTPFKEPVRLSNLCVAPETLVLTDKGHICIDELEDQNVTVWNGVEWSDVDVVKTGSGQKIVTVRLSDGKSIDCTEYHKFYVANGYKGTMTEKRAFELKHGEKLIKFDLPVVSGDKVLENAYENGFYTADGCTLKSGIAKIYLYHEKRSLKDRFKCIESWYEDDKQNRSVAHTRVLKDKFFVPDASYTVESRLEWLSGYLDGDGVVVRNGTNESIQATSIEKGFLREVQLMLQTLGVHSKIVLLKPEGEYELPANDGTGNSKLFHCKESERILISSTSLYKLASLGFKTSRLKWVKRKPQRNAEQFVSVLSVEDNGRYDDTYCFKEYKRGMGVFNGILTGQCQEICLPTKEYGDIPALYEYAESGEVALCFLGAMVVGNIESDEEYEEAVYQLCKFIDNTIDNAVYPFQSIEYTAKKRRSIGVGMTDVAHWMAKHGYKYDTEEGRNAVHRLAERHSYYLHKASVRLAKERGYCEWMDRTKYADNNPWLPIDTYNKNIDNHHSQDLCYDWESLRSDIKQYGVRFSVHEAFMPVESSSAFTNSTNGVYPIREHQIFKKSPAGVVFFEAPEWQELKDNYQRAWDIDKFDMAKFYGIIQKFTGQSISADFYHDYGKQKKVSGIEMIKLFLFAESIGMKTFYYMNSVDTNNVDGHYEVRDVEVDDSGCESCKL